MQIKVSKKDFKIALHENMMEHVGFASPDPWHGYSDRKEYYEGGNMKGIMVVQENGATEYWLERLPKDAKE